MLLMHLPRLWTHRSAGCISSFNRSPMKQPGWLRQPNWPPILPAIRSTPGNSARVGRVFFWP